MIHVVLINVTCCYDKGGVRLDTSILVSHCGDWGSDPMLRGLSLELDMVSGLGYL
jgi:hypothetical protein